MPTKKKIELVTDSILCITCFLWMTLEPDYIHNTFGPSGATIMNTLLSMGIVLLGYNVIQTLIKQKIRQKGQEKGENT